LCSELIADYRIILEKCIVIKPVKKFKLFVTIKDTTISKLTTAGSDRESSQTSFHHLGSVYCCHFRFSITLNLPRHFFTGGFLTKHLHPLFLSLTCAVCPSQPPINPTTRPYQRIMWRSVTWGTCEVVTSVEGISCRGLLRHMLANGALVYSSHGRRYGAEGRTALG
jgi:hypothetical protein